MPHRRVRRRKLDQAVRRRENGGLALNVVEFPVEQAQARFHREGNMVPDMSPAQIDEVGDLIVDRFRSGQAATDAINREIEAAERQFDGLFPDQEQDQPPDADDTRIFMNKTLEHCQLVHSHLDNLVSQLDPLVTFHPTPRGLSHDVDAHKRAKVKEILVNEYFRLNRVKREFLPRWRWNYLKHPSAVARVLYDENDLEPDLRIDLIDRGLLYVDPTVRTGDLKDAAWVIERTWVSEDEYAKMVREGWWSDRLAVPFSNPAAGLYDAADPMFRRLMGNRSDLGLPYGPDRDRLIEVWYYWQSGRRGEPAAFGVMVGGLNGQLVRFGPIPFAYKAHPYCGKAYLRDPYKPDGKSLVKQYRHIQELYNTFTQIRMEDVLSGVQNQMAVFENLFGETTQKDINDDQQFVRMSGALAQQIIGSGRKLSDFFHPLGGGDSTQHLLQDLQYLTSEGAAELHTTDAFRGENPQTNAPMGQYLEQIERAHGVFRPVYSQELALVEDIAEIVASYFGDPDFFGEERIAQVFGPSRYQDVLSDRMESDPRAGTTTVRASWDEMDVDVRVEAMDQAEHIATRTMRNASFDGFMESMRHHPELMQRMSRKVDMDRLFMQRFRDSGVDIDGLMLTEEQQQREAQQANEQRQQQMREQVEAQAAQEKAKEGARAQREIAVDRNEAQLEAQGEQGRMEMDHQQQLERVVAQVSAKLGADLKTLFAEHANQLERMREEARLEREALREQQRISVQSGGADVNTPSPGQGQQGS